MPRLTRCAQEIADRRRRQTARSDQREFTALVQRGHADRGGDDRQRRRHASDLRGQAQGDQPDRRHPAASGVQPGEQHSATPAFAARTSIRPRTSSARATPAISSSVPRPNPWSERTGAGAHRLGRSGRARTAAISSAICSPIPVRPCPTCSGCARTTCRRRQQADGRQGERQSGQADRRPRPWRRPLARRHAQADADRRTAYRKAGERSVDGDRPRRAAAPAKSGLMAGAAPVMPSNSFESRWGSFR